jgi:hypothetical protein
VPVDLGGRQSLNIFKVRYRSALNGRAVTLWVKVPYGGIFDLTEMLSRQLAKGQIHYFKVDAAKPHEIGEHRAELARARDALLASSAITRIDWAA